MWQRILTRYRNWRYGRWRQTAQCPTFILEELRSNGYHSQCGQDRWVAEVLLPNLRAGVFVDIGAHDGVSFSNTLYFEQQLGWTGLAVEPIPALFKELRTNRRCNTINCCVGEKSGRAQFQVISGYSEMLSGLVDQYDPRHRERIEREIAANGGTRRILEVDCLRLSQLLDAQRIQHIDYLSIDAEGAELPILNSLEWGRHSISVIGVENNYGDYRIPQLLKAKGYQWHSVVGDEFYVAEHSKSPISNVAHR
jgi:FkbM family methyltransferase